MNKPSILFLIFFITLSLPSLVSAITPLQQSCIDNFNILNFGKISAEQYSQCLSIGEITDKEKEESIVLSGEGFFNYKSTYCHRVKKILEEPKINEEGEISEIKLIISPGGFCEFKNYTAISFSTETQVQLSNSQINIKLPDEVKDKTWEESQRFRTKGVNYLGQTIGLYPEEEIKIIDNIISGSFSISNGFIYLERYSRNPFTLEIKVEDKGYVIYPENNENQAGGGDPLTLRNFMSTRHEETIMFLGNGTFITVFETKAKDYLDSGIAGKNSLTLNSFKNNITANYQFFIIKIGKGDKLEMKNLGGIDTPVFKHTGSREGYLELIDGEITLRLSRGKYDLVRSTHILIKPAIVLTSSSGPGRIDKSLATQYKILDATIFPSINKQALPPMA